jgi:putative endonuclease
MAYTYILKCSDGSYYIGSTVDLGARFEQHQAGRGSEYTKWRTPVELVWVFETPSIEEAFRREKQIQGWGRAKRQALIDGRLDLLPALSRSRTPRNLGPTYDEHVTTLPSGYEGA